MTMISRAVVGGVHRPRPPPTSGIPRGIRPSSSSSSSAARRAGAPPRPLARPPRPTPRVGAAGESGGRSDARAGAAATEEGEPWWSLSSLRRTAVAALASSLPDEALSEVHRSLSERSSGPSIREAIVGARAREEHLRSRRRDVEENDANGAVAALVADEEARRRIEEEAELRARERMEAELTATRERMRRDEEERRRARLKEEEEREARRTREEAFERWKMDVERERRREEGEGALPNRSRSHPVLGPEVASLPYKRIHLTPASTLASLPVYEDQRAYRHDRAKVMARDKKKTLWMGIPGIISLVEDEEGRLSIVDGQHRVGMMSLLEEEQRRIREEGSGIIGIAGANGAAKDELVDLDLDNVLVEVFFHRQVDGDADGRSVNGSKRLDPGVVRAAIFTEINKAEPVKLLDLPGVATKRTRAIIDHATSRLCDSYPVMFSPSQRCRAPHLNVDNLRDQLFAAEVIVRISAGSGGELLRWMEERNGELRERYGGDGGGDESLTKLGDGKRVSEAALKKARKHDFYLGLESTWLYK